MKELVLKLLEEVDSDIKEAMLQETPAILKGIHVGTRDQYYNFELIANPMQTILAWQSLRDSKKNQVTMLLNGNAQTEKGS